MTIAGAIAFDGFDVFIQITVAIAMLLTALIGDGYLRREGVEGSDFHVLAMMSASGAMMMGAANDLIVVFLGLEILSIALYVLAAFNPKRAESGEASLKYFVLGAFSSAVFVYGIALVYGATGSTNLPQIADYLSKNVVASNGVLLGGLALLLIGFGFKIAAVPFHMWSPDVYQGSPSPVTGFMAAVAKAGAFAALLRVFVSSFPTVRTDWQPVIWGVAILSLVVGAVVALVQRDVKRMMAYSSINHAGFILLGVETATARGVSAALYYLFTYMFLVIGSFGVITVMGRDGDTGHQITDYRGLARRQPRPGPGLRRAAARAGRRSLHHRVPGQVRGGGRGGGHPCLRLAVVAMVSAAVAAFFYLRVAITMFSPVGAVADRADGDPTGRTGEAVPDRLDPVPTPETGEGDERGGFQPAGAHRRASGRIGGGQGGRARPDADRAGRRHCQWPSPWCSGSSPSRSCPSPTRPHCCSPEHPGGPAGQPAGRCRAVPARLVSDGVLSVGRRLGAGEDKERTMASTPGGPPVGHPGSSKGRRRSNREMARLVVAGLGLILLIAFVLDNSQTVKVGFVFFNTELSLIWVLLIAAAAGRAGRPVGDLPRAATQARHQVGVEGHFRSGTLLDRPTESPPRTGSVRLTGPAIGSQ